MIYQPTVTKMTEDERIIMIIRAFFNNNSNAYKMLESNNIRVRTEGFRRFLIIKKLSTSVREFLDENKYWVKETYRGHFEITRLS